MTHKKRKAKYISFLIVHDNQGEPKTFKIHSHVLKLIIGLVIALIFLNILGAISYWKVAKIALDYNRLKEENFKLLKSLKQIDKLKEDLTLVQQYEKQLRGSMSGYVTVEKMSPQDSAKIGQLDITKMNVDQKKTIFNSIPVHMPAEGFRARGFETSSLFTDPHLGIDIAAPTGTPVRAAADGVVLFSGWTDDGGNVLILEHDYGFLSIYKHNERNLVDELERVSKGQVIALLGNTGKISSGPHLHFEIWRDGLPVDPGQYIGEGNKN